MNPKILLTLAISTLALSGCNQTEVTPAPSPVPTTPPAVETPAVEPVTMKGKIEAVSDQWNMYSNTELGFSIQYPQKNFLNGNKEYDVKVVEDGYVVYLDEGYNTDDIKQKRYLSKLERISGIPFAILVNDINTDEELESFIKERYGKTCKLGKKEASGQAGVFNVGIDGLTIGDDPEGCFVNYITTIKYAPEKGKVATWDVGQDVNFYTKDLEALDKKVSDSFKFL